MKHLASILLFIFVATESFAATERHIIHSVVKNVTGNVLIRDGKTKKLIALTNGTVLKPGDGIQTLEKSSFEIHFEDESVMTAMPDTGLAVKNLWVNPDPGPHEPTYYSRFQLFEGEVKASVSKTTGVWKEFEVRTDGGIVSIDSATKLVNYSPKGGMQVSTLQDPVIVQNPETAKRLADARKKIVDDRKAAKAQKIEEARKLENARRLADARNPEEARKIAEEIKLEEAREAEEPRRLEKARKAYRDKRFAAARKHIAEIAEGERPVDKSFYNDRTGTYDYKHRYRTDLVSETSVLTPLNFPNTAKTETKKVLGYAMVEDVAGGVSRITDKTTFKPGDIIHTGPGSSFDMQLEDGSVVTVTSLTVMKVAQLRSNPYPEPNEPKYQTKFKLRAGEVKVSTSKQEGVLKTFKVQTPRGTVRIDDATKVVNYSPKGGMKVNTLQGQTLAEDPKEVPKAIKALTQAPEAIKINSSISKKLKDVQARQEAGGSAKKLKTPRGLQKLAETYKNAAEIVEQRYQKKIQKLIKRFTSQETEEMRENLQWQINNGWDINRRWDLRSCDLNGGRMAPTRHSADLKAQALSDLIAFQVHWENKGNKPLEVRGPHGPTGRDAYDIALLEEVIAHVQRNRLDPYTKDPINPVRLLEYLRSKGHNYIIDLARHLHKGQVLAERGLPVTEGGEVLAGIEFLLDIVYAKEYEDEMMEKAQALQRDWSQNKEKLIEGYRAKLLREYQTRFEKEFEAQMQGKGNASPEIQQLIDINKLVAGL